MAYWLEIILYEKAGFKWRYSKHATHLKGQIYGERCFNETLLDKDYASKCYWNNIFILEIPSELLLSN